MSKLLGTDNKPIGLLAFDLVSGESSSAIVVRVIAENAQLMSEANADVKLKARRHGTSDPYQDLSSDPIDLSGFTPGDALDFDFIAVADESITGLLRCGIFFGVTKSGPAAWAA